MIINTTVNFILNICFGQPNLTLSYNTTLQRNLFLLRLPLVVKAMKNFEKIVYTMVGFY
ncbi:hypothetical protein WH47_03849 [Habropoda laboriosa]|uniref:Uncharacterized protein n=1 Tax=Habropoda laboriosa TaxID=597456 RepID=A0A0L7QVD3_9HYME|nr:hypothetical protein WH47_03849 [Habropoda laboriosa]